MDYQGHNDNIKQQECLRMQWRLIRGGQPKRAQRDRLEEWSVRLDKQRRNVLKLL
jgi:hypothetical protein